MPPSEVLLGVVLFAALAIYFLLGVADFGRGLWDLLASGPRRREQRALVARSMGPVWEVNHVWLILAVVVLFTAFAPAFATISVALHVPLTLFLVCVVLRGSAFAFRSLDLNGEDAQRRWGLVFSVASVVAPVLLGAVVGAVASGGIRTEGGVVVSGFFASWLRPFPVAVGLLALALAALLAASYLAREAAAQDAALADDFRARALAAAVATGVAAVVVFLTSAGGAPGIREGLTGRPGIWPLHAATATVTASGFAALWTRRYAAARALSAAQAALILVGWAMSQYPFLVVPQVTLQSAAAPDRTLRLLLIALAAGTPLLVPSLYVLHRAFKRRQRGG